MLTRKISDLPDMKFDIVVDDLGVPTTLNTIIYTSGRFRASFHPLLL